MKNTLIKLIKSRAEEIYSKVLVSEEFKRGNILCPFHADNNPSLRIFINGSFKCFGCGKHGDIITFIAQLNGLSTKGEDFIKTINIIRRRYL